MSSIFPSAFFKFLFSALLWSLMTTHLLAYSSFDEVLEVNPTWSPLPDGPLVSEQLPVDAREVRFRVIIVGADRVRLEMRNPSRLPLSVQVRLPLYQTTKETTTLQVAAGATGEALINVVRTDRLCTESAVQFSSINLGNTVVSPRPLVSVPPPVARAYAVATTWEHAGFRAASIAYSITVINPETIDLHLLNRSGQIVHADLLVVGWQRPGATVPRVHLLPGVMTEMLIPVSHADAATVHASLALWAVRVGTVDGDDGTPLMGTGPDDPTRFITMEDSWHTVAFGESAIAGFNPNAMIWKVSDSGITVRNRAPLRMGAHLTLLGGAQRFETDIQLDGLATVALPLTFQHDGNVLATAPTLAGIAVTVAPLTIDPAPANALAVRARWPDPRFNALTVIATVTGAAGGGLQAQVVFANRAAVTLHAEWHLPGYQVAAANPRLHLAPGASVRLLVPVTKRDIRLGLAQPALWDVRLGDDSGPACCTAPSP